MQALRKTRAAAGLELNDVPLPQTCPPDEVLPAVQAAYEAWHAHEHVPERLTVPGMRWACRYGRLVAQRLPQARPLAWLQAGQDRGLAGERLLAVCLHDAGPAPAAAVYGRLPAAHLDSPTARPRLARAVSSSAA